MNDLFERLERAAVMLDVNQIGNAHVLFEQLAEINLARRLVFPSLHERHPFQCLAVGAAERGAVAVYLAETDLKPHAQIRADALGAEYGLIVELLLVRVFIDGNDNQQPRVAGQVFRAAQQHVAAHGLLHGEDGDMALIRLLLFTALLGVRPSAVIRVKDDEHVARKELRDMQRFELLIGEIGILI